MSRHLILATEFEGAEMLVLSLGTEQFVKETVAAASSTFAGLMLVLARSADVREQHPELVRDWANLHDVTGPLLAVLCPEPPPPDAGHEIGPPVGLVGRNGSGFFTPGLRLTPRLRLNPYLSQLNHLTSQQLLDRRDFTAPRRAAAANALEDAWTRSASGAARVLGVREGDLPSALVLSFWEQRAVRIDLRADVPLYRICRELVAALEPKTDELTRALQRLERAEFVRGDIALENGKYERAHAGAARLRRHLAEVQRGLAQIADVDPALIARCQAGIADLLQGDPAPGLARELDLVHSILPALSPRRGPQHSLVRGLADRLRQPEVPPLGPISNPYPDRFGPAQRELTEATADFSARRQAFGLADAVIATSLRVLPGTVVKDGPGFADLAGWHISSVAQ